MSDVRLPVGTQHVDHLPSRVRGLCHKVCEHPDQGVLVLQDEEESNLAAWWPSFLSGTSPLVGDDRYPPAFHLAQLGVRHVDLQRELGHPDGELQLSRQVQLDANSSRRCEHVRHSASNTRPQQEINPEEMSEGEERERVKDDGSSLGSDYATRDLTMAEERGTRKRGRSKNATNTLQWRLRLHALVEEEKKEKTENATLKARQILNVAVKIGHWNVVTQKRRPFKPQICECLCLMVNERKHNTLGCVSVTCGNICTERRQKPRDQNLNGYAELGGTCRRELGDGNQVRLRFVCGLTKTTPTERRYAVASVPDAIIPVTDKVMQVFFGRSKWVNVCHLIWFFIPPHTPPHHHPGDIQFDRQ
ncbi:hypothetical protein EYF80_014829 [Liparis tanakae]|uniref:Uncharacterized protein n=1 Tax=Liparis tanakae TaxID=230148 RepID=A0A4Z2IB33_9TELE|nr:hypothetical protein EYF80_014829 [Liparis tanakae]